jgi:NAD(P)-dependent dehydrogenase (short-subunit alcohol dehydrogenase family)
MRRLEEQTILVTGASDGHGKRVAQKLVERGATVVVHGRSRAKTEPPRERSAATRYGSPISPRSPRCAASPARSTSWTDS